VSYERIYLYNYSDKRAGGSLHNHLRCQKKRRKRYGSYDRRGKIPARKSIEERPKVVDLRKRLRDWEADTVIGKVHQGVLVTLTERKARFMLLRKADYKSAELVAQTIIDLLSWVKHLCTITVDNGKEFAAHQMVSMELLADFYFAHPYASLGARYQREHQSFDPPIPAEGSRFDHGYSQRRDFDHGSAQSTS